MSHWIPCGSLDGTVFPLGPFQFLSTGFEDLYLGPSGEVGLIGLIYEDPFLRETRECKREGGKSIKKVIFQ